MATQEENIYFIPFAIPFKNIYNTVLAIPKHSKTMSPNYSLFDKYLRKLADATISHFGSHERVLQFLQAFKRYPGNVAFCG